MALTVTNKASSDTPATVPYERKAVVAKITFDNSYPTGGEALTASQVGLSEIDAVFGHSAGFLFEYDVANAKLKAFYADYDAVADGALIEVDAGTDLADLSPTLIIVGV